MTYRIEHIIGSDAVCSTTSPAAGPYEALGRYLDAHLPREDRNAGVIEPVDGGVMFCSRQHRITAEPVVARAAA